MFNMQDPTVGGFGLEKVALRRAISLAYNQAEAIKQLYKGQAVKSEMLVPEGVQGFNRIIGVAWPITHSWRINYWIVSVIRREQMVTVDYRMVSL